jgi:hypothetical protein
VDHVIALLFGMEKFSFADKESVRCAIVEIEEVRCDINADFTEGLQLRRSNSVLRQVGTRSPHETTTNITKSLCASAR